MSRVFVEVELSDGTSFTAEIANLTTKSVFIKTERPLHFAQHLRLSLLGTMVEAEVAYAPLSESPSGAVLVFDLTPDVAETLTGEIDEIDVVGRPAQEIHAEAAAIDTFGGTGDLPPPLELPVDALVMIGGDTSSERAESPDELALHIDMLEPVDSGEAEPATTPVLDAISEATAPDEAEVPAAVFVPPETTRPMDAKPRTLADLIAAADDVSAAPPLTGEPTPLPVLEQAPAPQPPRSSIPPARASTPPAPLRSSIPPAPAPQRSTLPPPTVRASSMPAPASVRSGPAPLASDTLTGEPTPLPVLEEAPHAPLPPPPPSRMPPPPPSRLPPPRSTSGTRLPPPVAGSMPPPRATSGVRLPPPAITPPPVIPPPIAAPVTSPPAPITPPPVVAAAAPASAPITPELPKIDSDGVTLRFGSRDQYRAQYKANIQHGGIIAEATALPIGTQRFLGIEVPGLARYTVSARVTFLGEGTVGFVIDSFPIHRAQLRAYAE